MNIEWTLGAYEIGLVFATVLYGIVVAQTFTYTQEKFMDPILLKILVGTVCLFDTIHTFAIWALLYYWSVNNFGSETGLLKIHWMFILAFAFSPTIGAIVQSFFAYRMFLLLTRPYLPIIIWMGALTRIGFAVVRVVALARSGTIPQAVLRFGWILTTSLSINVVLDTLNTSGLLYCLLKNRNNLIRSRKTVDKLLRYTVEIGLTTTICAIITLGLVQYRAHQNFIFIAFFVIYPKLFANSFLASLNARAQFRRESTTVMSDICVVQDSHPEEHLLETVRGKGTSTASSSTHPPDSPASSLRAPAQSEVSSEHS